MLCSGFAHNALLLCLKFSVWRTAVQQSHSSCNKTICDSLRASATSQGVLLLSQSYCVTSQSCWAMSQDCCYTNLVITPSVGVGAVDCLIEHLPVEQHRRQCLFLGWFHNCKILLCTSICLMPYWMGIYLYPLWTRMPYPWDGIILKQCSNLRLCSYVQNLRYAR